MSIELVRLLAQTFSSSILNSARPALTFFTIQLAVIYMSWMEVAVVPDNFAWLISPVTISVAGFLAILEHFALHEEDVQNMLHEFNVTPLLSAFAVVKLKANVIRKAEKIDKSFKKDCVPSNLDTFPLYW